MDVLLAEGGSPYGVVTSMGSVPHTIPVPYSNAHPFAVLQNLGNVSSASYSPPTSQFMDISLQPSQLNSVNSHQTQVYPGMFLSTLTPLAAAPQSPLAAAAYPQSPLAAATAAGVPPSPLAAAAYPHSPLAAAAARSPHSPLAAAAMPHSPQAAAAAAALYNPQLAAAAAAAANSVGASQLPKLVLIHQCWASGCSNPSCLLCQHNLSRACSSHLKSKYISKDHLTAKCGAALSVALVAGDGPNGQVQQHTPGLDVKICLINALKYKETRDVDGYIQGLVISGLVPGFIIDKPLLKWGVGVETSHVTRSLEGGVLSLADLKCMCVSGENQSGKASEFRLLMYAPGRIDITPFVSDTFTVVTTRSKAAVKADIPTVTDLVRVLDGIGDQANVTLAELQERLEFKLPDHLKSVTQVGQFLELHSLVKSQPALESELKSKKLFKQVDLDRAASHAAKAVYPDYRPRVWWAPDGLIQQQQQQQRWGVLFRCKLGAIQLDQPLAAVQQSAAAAAAGGGDLRSADLRSPDQVMLLTNGISEQVRDLALQDWNSEGHSSWGIYWGDASDPCAVMAFGPGFQQQQQWPHGILAAAGLPDSAAAGILPAAAAATVELCVPSYASSQPPPLQQQQEQEQERQLPGNVRLGQVPKQQRSTVLQLLLQRQQSKQRRLQQQQQQQQGLPFAPSAPSLSSSYPPTMILTPPLQPSPPPPPQQQQQSPTMQQFVPGPMICPASLAAAAAVDSSGEVPAALPRRTVTWPPMTGYDEIALTNHQIYQQQQQQYSGSSDLGLLFNISENIGHHLTKPRSFRSERSLSFKSIASSAAAAASNIVDSVIMAFSGSDCQRNTSLDIARLQSDDLMPTDCSVFAEVNRQFTQSCPEAFERSISFERAMSF